MALAGYAFIFGTLALSGVVDIYYEYSFTVITRAVDLVPVPIVVSLLQAVLLVALLGGVSYYLIKPSWKDVKPYILALGKEKSVSLKPPPPPHDETEGSEPGDTPLPQHSDSNSSVSPPGAREQEILFGLVSLVLASFLVTGLSLWWPALSYRYTAYRVSERGMRIRRGVVWRTVSSVPRSRVQHTDVSQGPIERMFGLATLVIYTAGTHHASVLLSGLAHDTALRIRDHLIAGGEDDAV